MPTAEEKFRKLLAAYEDEIQRKQHKMGKKVEPTDEAQPNPSSGYCTFLRHGQQVIWSPSFDVIGTFDTGSQMWTWGWADQTLEPRIRSRIDGVRKQGGEWGIDLLTNGMFTIEGELQAWELSTVATAVTHADAMYRVVDGPRIRFLALYDGPPPSRSASLRAAPRADSQMNIRIPSSAAMPALGRVNTPYPSSSQRSPGSSSSRPAASARPPAAPAPIVRATTNPPPMPSIGNVTSTPAIPIADATEPSDGTRAEIGQRIFELLTTSQQGALGQVNLMARALPQTGPVGSVQIDSRLILRPRDGIEQTLVASPALQDALIALWLRCRDRAGTPYRFVTARLEKATPGGFATHVFLEY